MANLSTIYLPKGRAQEYSELALNHYSGCSHGCVYCYVPNAMFKDRKEFHASVTPRTGIIEALELDAPKYAGQEVFLSFACDPYCPEDDKYNLTRQVIQTLHDNRVAVNILTKGGNRAIKDFDLLTANLTLSRIGATLTAYETDADYKKWEPGAAIIRERIDMLYHAKCRGIKTWASIEPVINPELTLSLIEIASPYVDHFKIGRWNHDKRAKDIDWPKFLKDVTELLDRLGNPYYIKKDLAIFSDNLC